MQRARLLMATASTVALSGVLVGGPALAQDDEAEVRPVESIVVYGENIFRDRAPDINPTLSYGLDFFQRFEPETVGEMLKRTPGVVFSGDVLEYDAVQLRGLGAEYTEVLVNGRRIPGQGSDGTFFVDRIPAELIERIEIVRSPSADITSEGIGGALNVILKDGQALQGALARVGATYYGDADDAVRYSGAFALADAGDKYDYWIGANVQQRRNPKEKVELFLDVDDEDIADGEPTFDFEDDTRDGVDYSLNGSLGLKANDGAEFRFNGFYVFTDRKEHEYTPGYQGTFEDKLLVLLETQVENIDQHSYGLEGVYSAEALGGKLEAAVGFSGYDEDTTSIETEQEFEDGVGGEIDTDDDAIDLEDKNYYVNVSQSFATDAPLSFKIGVDSSWGEREGTQDSRIAPVDIEATVSQTRIAPFVVATLEPVSGLVLEGGLRGDHYERTVTALDEDDVAHEAGQDADELLPSVNVRYDLTDADRFHFSVARTVRRPGFELVMPLELEDEPDDEQILRGNPDLKSETAVGVDLGYERRLSARGGGIVGVNLFYRDIEDVIQLVSTGEPSGLFDDDEEGLVFEPRNVGDGWTAGVEFDVSTPLGFIGLPDTGFYANLALLDSEVDSVVSLLAEDAPEPGRTPVISRRFRDQPEYVYNVTLSQNFPRLGAAAGVSYQKRGESNYIHDLEEDAVLEYDANVEAFIEKRLGDRVVVRLSGTNLLDAVKTETFRDLEVLDDGQVMLGDVKEIQIEDSSPTYTLTVRTAF